MPGFRKEFVISDKGALSFSRDGTRLFFACAPPAPEKKPDAADAPADDSKAVVDLWSYKDDYIQPMQKVRAERDRNRTFTAAYLIPERKIVQLADAALETVTPSESAQWVMGTDDREYRPLADYDERYADAYLIDAVTGARTLLAKKQRGSMTWSPVRPLPAVFRRQGLEHRIGARRQEGQPHGQPGRRSSSTRTPIRRARPAPTATAAGPRMAKSLLLYDRYDIWRVGAGWQRAPRTSPPGYGRAHDLRLRYVRTEAENPRERWIDRREAGDAAGRESQDVRDRLFPRLARWRRAQATCHVAQIPSRRR